MDFDFTSIFGTLISASKNLNDQYGHREPRSKRWQMCVALTKLGWKIKSWEPIKHREEDDHMNNVRVIWEKESFKDITIELGVMEQYAWFRQMEKQKEKKNDKQ